MDFLHFKLLPGWLGEPVVAQVFHQWKIVDDDTVSIFVVMCNSGLNVSISIISNFPFEWSGGHRSSSVLPSARAHTPLRDGRALCFQTAAAELSASLLSTPPPFFCVSHVRGHDCRFMEIIEPICFGNLVRHFLQRLFFEFLCIKTTFWIT